MNWFKKLPGFVKNPPGLERDILRLLPRILALGTVFLGSLSVTARLFPRHASAADVTTWITSVDIYVISALVLHWTSGLTVAIGAFVVLVMKGPAYVADAYPLQDSRAPAPPETSKV